MKGSGKRQVNATGDSGLRWRLVLAVVIFLAWLLCSAAILYVSRLSANTTPQETRQTSTVPKETSAPFSSSVDEGGRLFRVFDFPPAIATGKISGIVYKQLGTVRGKPIFSALDVVKFNTTIAQGKIKFPNEQRLSFTPGETLAVNNTSLTRFRPGEIYDITMKRVQDIDVDVYLDGCSQIKGVQRLDISDCADLTKEGAVFIDDYTSLRALQLYVRKGAINPVSHLSAIKKVSSLGLTSKEDLYQVLLAIRPSINLRALRLQSAVMSDQDLSTIAAMPMLEELSLASPLFEKPEALTNALKILCRQPHLKILNLQTGEEGRAAPLNKAGEALLQNCKSLEVLQLGKEIKMISHN